MSPRRRLLRREEPTIPLLRGRRGPPLTTRRPWPQSGGKVLVRGSDAGGILGRTTPSKGSALQRAVSRERFSFRGMREILTFYLRRLTEILPCSSDLSPSQESSSSGDLLSEMMESGTPPPAVPPSEVGDPEVSSWRVSLNLAGAEDSYVASQGSPRPASKEAIGQVRVWCSAGGAKDSAGASFYLRGAPCIDGHGD